MCVSSEIQTLAAHSILLTLDIPNVQAPFEQISPNCLHFFSLSFCTNGLSHMQKPYKQQWVHTLA